MAQTTILQSHLKFRESLQGQPVYLPNLYSLLPEWKVRIHPQYRRAREEVLNPWIEWLLQKAEFGIFAAIMCADTSFEKMCTVAKSFAWACTACLFTCERRLTILIVLYLGRQYDCCVFLMRVFDCGLLTHDMEAIKSYRATTVEYFKHVLCADGKFPDLSGYPEELQNALHCWDEVAEHICEQMIFYVASVDTVDAICSGDTIPSLMQYWRRRERTAGVYPVMATIPYVILDYPCIFVGLIIGSFIYGYDISKADLATDLMTLLWRHTSYLVHIQNDMFSLRKEIRDNQIENLVTVVMLNEGLDCNQAMQLSFCLAQEIARSFHEVEDNVRCTTTGRSRTVSSIFNEGCKNIAMGLTFWSYSGQRYFENSEVGVGNEIWFQL
ncbi:terpenoid synthase [Penicillium vulpinum]|uniref:terpenoid synthase n=1 Tax=Penicillium vulpinum TaxID=29845 RepID=UPI002546C068|nr:terpenoid synthase [Penicillium vulpinum]KAJ5963615.1 terpenoid synthase [Penicillium vulpinum]